MSSLEICFVDPISEKHVYKTPSGQELKLRKHDGVLAVYVGDERIGHIWVSDSRGSGSIFARRRDSGFLPVGEYSYGPNGYTVIPYVDGMKDTSLRREVHPLDFLVEVLDLE